MVLAFPGSRDCLCLGPGSAKQRCTLRRVRDTRIRFLSPSPNRAILFVATNHLTGLGGVMNRAGKISVSLTLLAAVFSVGNRAAQAQIQPQAQQNPPTSSVLSQIQARNEECKRKYPDPVKQAMANATCENRNMELLRPQMVYPDLMDQELANNLMLAEKVQKGKMTLIEMKAVKAQLHSQIVTEFQRRQLAKMSAAVAPDGRAGSQCDGLRRSALACRSGEPEPAAPLSDGAVRHDAGNVVRLML